MGRWGNARSRSFNAPTTESQTQGPSCPGLAGAGRATATEAVEGTFTASPMFAYRSCFEPSFIAYLLPEGRARRFGMTLSNPVMHLFWASTVCDLFTPHAPGQGSPPFPKFHFDSSRPPVSPVQPGSPETAGGHGGDRERQDSPDSISQGPGTKARRRVEANMLTCHGHIHRAARQPCHQSKGCEGWSASWRLVPSKIGGPWSPEARVLQEG